MKKWTQKIGCAVMSAAMVFSLNFSGLSIQKVEASGEYVVNKGSGDAYTAIQNCLDKAKDSNGGTVKVPAGTYEISDVLRIYSNTTLQLDKNATIKRAAGNGKIMIVNGSYDDTSKGGYSKNTGITITGGTWDGSNGSSTASENSNNLYFGHASNITIKDTTIKNCYGEHLLELTAVKDSTVKNVKFDNFIGKYNEENAYKEALQLDYTDETTSEAFPPYDKTACQNITITSCEFKNYPAGVGSHSMGINKHSNIEISSCSFENITNVCVDAQNYLNIKVSNSKQTGKNPVAFIKAKKTTGSSSGNIISGASKYAMWIEEGSDISCSGDTISGIKDTAIDVSGSSKATLDGETISKSSNYGINVNNSTAVIKNSTITDTSNKCAINAVSSYIGVSGNTLTNCGENGIYMSNPSNLSFVDANKITNASYSGIFVDGGNKGITVSSNTLNNTGKYGILVYGANGVTIKQNDISKYSEYGIYVRESDAGARSSNITISGNKVSNGPSGIVARKTDKAEISGNTTSAINNYDIYVNENCRNTTVKNNKYAVQVGVYDTSASVSGNAQQKTTSEIKKINGKWVYANGNTVVTSYTGLAKYGGSWWYIKNGYLDFNYTGLYYYNGTWWYVQSGKINFGYSGLCKYNGSWWYITGGQVNFKYTGLYKYNGNWWYIHGGRIEFESTTLVQYNGTWWYVSGGYVRFGATGLCNYAGRFWYVQNGRVNFNAVTVVKYNGTWWYVNGGYVRFDAQGLCKYAGTWWYIRDGRINFSYKGLVRYNGTWWYVSGGKIDWNYSGTTTYNGATYRVSGGRLA